MYGGSPTLLTLGAITQQNWMSEEEKLSTRSDNGITFIIRWLSLRIPDKRGNKPKLNPLNQGDKILLLQSGTGSGKSTILPPKIYENFYEGLKKNIGITEPQVINAIEIPGQIIQYQTFLKMEENIGYQTGEFKKTPVRGILFMTVGILLQHFKTLDDEQIMSKYMVIIIDECHSRDIVNDELFYLIELFLSRNWSDPDCPFFIFMSATFDPEVFIKYFKIPDKNFIEVIGQTFPIKEFWAEKDVTNIIDYIAQKVKEIHINNSDDVKDVFRDILVFLPGQNHIKHTKFALHKLNLQEEFAKHGYIAVVELTGNTIREKGRDYNMLNADIEDIDEQLIVVKGGNMIRDILLDTQSVELAPIATVEYKDIQGLAFAHDSEYKWRDAGLDWEDELIYKYNPVYGGTPKVVNNEINDIISKIDLRGIDGGGSMVPNYEFGKTVKPNRRVFLATNAVETGVTIETLKYCIDSGFRNSVEFNPNINSKTMILTNVTQGMAIQRRGRAGRKCPGVWYSLYTKDIFNKMCKDQHPQIITSDITLTILNLFIKEYNVKFTDINDKVKIDSRIGFNIQTLKLMGYPSSDSIIFSIEKLLHLGFLTQSQPVQFDGGAIIPTKLGVIANSFRKIRIESISMILSGFRTGAYILDLITIATMLEYMWSNITRFRLNKRYKSCNPLELEEYEADLYYRFFWADEFTEMLFIWYMFMDKLQSSSLDELQEWCKTKGINMDGMFMISKDRDELIESLINMGINVYKNGLNLAPGKYDLLQILKGNIEEGYMEICKIKEAIKFGFQRNVAVWNTHINKYVSYYNHLPIFVESKLVQPIGPFTQPNKIIFGSLITRQNPFNPSYYTTSPEGPIMVI
jgi:HrpA-like RNA helicase